MTEVNQIQATSSLANVADVATPVKGRKRAALALVFLLMLMALGGLVVSLYGSKVGLFSGAGKFVPDTGEDTLTAELDRTMRDLDANGFSDMELDGLSVSDTLGTTEPSAPIKINNRDIQELDSDISALDKMDISVDSSYGSDQLNGL